MLDPGWAGAWCRRIAGADVLVGDVALFAGALPAPDARDLAEAGTRQGERRSLYLRRRALLRHLASRRLGLAAEAVAVGYDPRGAPSILAPAAPILHVSVTARGRLAGFALAERPVGIDIEPFGDPGPLDAVLTAAERAALAGAPEEGRIVAALRYWTAKEARLKALGTGLLRDPAGVEIVPRPADAFAVRGSTGQGSWFAPELRGVALVAAVYVEGEGTE